MSEALIIVLTSSLTILGSVTVFVFGQLTEKFVINPLHERSKLIGEIANSLIYYANVDAGVESYYFQQIQNINQQNTYDEIIKELFIERYKELLKKEWARSDEAKVVFRQQASRLMEKTNAIPLYNFWVVLSLWHLPTKRAVIEASRSLIGYSNDTTTSIVRGKEIAKKLRMKIVYEKYSRS